jgi:hypothetical protein
MTAEPWRGIGDSESAQVRFIAQPSGEMQFECENFLYTYGRRGGTCEPRGAGYVVVHGSRLQIRDDPWFLDRRTGMLFDAADCGRRLVAATKRGLPWIDGSPLARLEDVYALLKSPDPIARREATFFLPLANQAASADRRVDPSTMLSDPDVQVRCTAAWACGNARSKEACAGLLELAKSAFAGERREAARALRAIGGKEAASTLQAMQNDPDPLVREAAKQTN